MTSPWCTKLPSESKNKKQPLDILFGSLSKPIKFNRKLTKQIGCDLLSSDYLKMEFNKYLMIKNKTKFNTLIHADLSRMLNTQKTTFSNSILSLELTHYLTKPKNVFLNKIYMDYLRTTTTNRGIHNLVAPVSLS